MTTQVMETAKIGHNSQANEFAAIISEVAGLNREFKKAKEDKERRATKAMTLFQMAWQYADKMNDWNAIRVFCQESDEFGKIAARIFNAICDSHLIGVEKGNFYMAKVMDENGKPLHRKMRFDNNSRSEMIDYRGRIDKIISDLDLEPDVTPTENQLIEKAKERAKKDALAIKNNSLPVSVYLVALKEQLESLGVK